MQQQQHGVEDERIDSTWYEFIALIGTNLHNVSDTRGVNATHDLLICISSLCPR